MLLGREEVRKLGFYSDARNATTCAVAMNDSLMHPSSICKLAALHRFVNMPFQLLQDGKHLLVFPTPVQPPPHTHLVDVHAADRCTRAQN